MPLVPANKRKIYQVTVAQLALLQMLCTTGHLKRHGAGLLVREVPHAVVPGLHLVEQPQAGRLGVEVPLQGPQVLLV